MALVAVLGGLLIGLVLDGMAGPARRAVPALRSADVVLDGDGGFRRS